VAARFHAVTAAALEDNSAKASTGQLPRAPGRSTPAGPNRDLSWALGSEGAHRQKLDRRGGARLDRRRRERRARLTREVDAKPGGIGDPTGCSIVGRLGDLNLRHRRLARLEAHERGLGRHFVGGGAELLAGPVRYEGHAGVALHGALLRARVGDENAVEQVPGAPAPGVRLAETRTSPTAHAPGAALVAPPAAGVGVAAVAVLVLPLVPAAGLVLAAAEVVGSVVVLVTVTVPPLPGPAGAAGLPLHATRAAAHSDTPASAHPCFR